MNMAIKLVAFDMEGCLTDEPTVWEIMHRRLGTWDSHGQPYWDRYRAGEFDYDTFARMDVAAWAGAAADELRAAARAVALMPGCRELMEGLAAAGVRVAVISNGLVEVAGRFREQFGVEHIFANRVVCCDGRLTGEIEIRVPYGEKGAILRRLARATGLRPAEVAAVGDSASDVAMFAESRIGIAFRPSDPVVSAAATHTVLEKDLRELLPLLVSGA